MLLGHSKQERRRRQRRTSKQREAEDIEMARENKWHLTKLSEEITYNTDYYYLSICLPEEKSTVLCWKKELLFAQEKAISARTRAPLLFYLLIPSSSNIYIA